MHSPHRGLASAAAYAGNAFDNASDPVYADGWQAGDNGGFGFTAWDFSTDPGPSSFHAIDDGLQALVADRLAVDAAHVRDLLKCD